MGYKTGRIYRGGYVYIKKWEHPFVGKQGYVAEHRLVVEAAIGRYLLPTEAVHHINEMKDDNRLENLELCESHGSHILKHHPEHIDFLRRVNIGIRRSPLTEFKKGQIAWNKGIKKPMPQCSTCQVELKDRRSISCRKHR